MKRTDKRLIHELALQMYYEYLKQVIDRSNPPFWHR